MEVKLDLIAPVDYELISSVRTAQFLGKGVPIQGETYTPQKEK
jgi:hypothetical protein